MPPAEEIEQRLRRFAAALSEDGLDAAVVVQSTDLAYLTGTNQQAHLIVPAAGEPWLGVRRTLARAREESPLSQIDPLPSLSGLSAALAAAGVGAGATVGFELDVLPAARYLGYVRRLEGYRAADCSPAIRRVRAVKSGWELEQMRRAGEQVRAAAEAVPSLLAEDVPESKVQREVESVLRAAGHQGQLRFRGFNQEMHYGQVLCGPSGAVPGYSDSPLCGPGPNAVLGKGPDGHRLRRGDPVIVDLVGGYDGYLADQTRTFALGPLHPDLREAYATAVAILRSVEQLIRPGTAPSALFAHAERMAGEAGLGEHFMGHGPDRVRFLGHGVGMEIDELPVLAPGFDAPLVPGHVIAVEPKFVFPDRGAVGIENMYAVTETGWENLTTASEELIEV
ncbi:MAG TPA: Xaa-Pro peptidase family protein [Gaiellales bacterium]|nr:Xaa-Pro peptidase family protein [Gaiellales bacterium]